MSDSEEPDQDSTGGEDFAIGWLELLAGEPAEDWKNATPPPAQEIVEKKLAEAENRIPELVQDDSSTTSLESSISATLETRLDARQENRGANHEVDDEILLDNGELMWLDEMETVPEMNDNPQENVEKHPPGESPTGQVDGEDLLGVPVNEDSGAVPEDPDDAIAWLERLAARQGAPAEELPTTMKVNSVEDEDVDRTETDAIQPELDDGEIPEDPDEAMAWLERLAARQGASKDELTTQGELAEVEEPAPAHETEEVIGVEASDAFVLGDLDEALDWLEDLTFQSQAADAVAIETGETLVSEEPLTPAVAHDIEAALAGADLLFAEPDTAPVTSDIAKAEDAALAEDSEDAMAWLEQLAARQGAPIEELTTLQEEKPDGRTMEDIAALTAAESLSELDGDAAIEREEPSVVSQLDEVAPLVEVADQEALGYEEVLASEAGELAETEEGEEEDLGWLDTLGAVDATGWLVAEAAVEQSEVPLESEVVAESKPMGELEAPPTEPISELAEILPEAPEAEELREARQAILVGALDSGLDAYSALVEQGKLLPFLIDDLEAMTEQHGAEPKLQRLLGDAYARNGQLQKALQTYREALDNL